MPYNDDEHHYGMFYDLSIEYTIYANIINRSLHYYYYCNLVVSIAFFLFFLLYFKARAHFFSFSYSLHHLIAPEAIATIVVVVVVVAIYLTVKA
jgi:hypothetical protein